MVHCPDFVIFLENHSGRVHRDTEQGHDYANDRPAVLPAEVCPPEDETAGGKLVKVSLMPSRCPLWARDGAIASVVYETNTSFFCGQTEPFWKPVALEQHPDYAEYIYHPMDLATLEKVPLHSHFSHLADVPIHSRLGAL